MPEDNDIRKYVLREIAAHANISEENIEEDYRLKDPPLMFDNTGLLYLAKSLRGYVNTQTDGNETVRVKEIRAGNLTVEQVVALITKKIISP